MDKRVVALGDSLTEGYPFQQKFSWVNLLAAEQGWDLINKGINGETTGEMLGRFFQDVVYVKADIVIITGGANDVFQRVPVDVITDNYRRMIEMAKRRAMIPVIGFTLPVDDPALEQELCTLRKNLQQIVAQYELPSINFHGALVDINTGQIAKKWDYDGVHPNPEGYARMAKVAQPVLACLLNEINEDRTVTPLLTGTYRHYKGNLYEVLGVAKHSETLEEMVVYRALYGEYGLWVRPLAMFLETVTVDGNTVKRFEKIEKQDVL